MLSQIYCFQIDLEAYENVLDNGLLNDHLNSLNVRYPDTEWIIDKKTDNNFNEYSLIISEKIFDGI